MAPRQIPALDSGKVMLKRGTTFGSEKGIELGSGTCCKTKNKILLLSPLLLMLLLLPLLLLIIIIVIIFLLLI
jgi:hypothetical protein